jgi:hypothetical protein
VNCRWDHPATGKNRGVKAGWFRVPAVKPVLMMDGPQWLEFDPFIRCLGAGIKSYLGKKHEKHDIGAPKIALHSWIGPSQACLQESDPASVSSGCPSCTKARPPARRIEENRGSSRI